MPLSFQTNKPLKPLTTIGIGGAARYFVEVRTVDQMQEVVRRCKDEGLEYIVLGKGSNVLFDDRGYHGVVILNKIDFYEVPEEGLFHVGAGYSFSLLGARTARQGWSGLEFASGIPGSVGGAVYMNAGANGRETCDSLLSVDYVNAEGDVCSLHRKDLEFSYRTSPFQTMKGAIVGATFKLEPSTSAREKQLDIIGYRKKTQPYSQKSAGCMFRNPTCGHAGALIEKSGLKGFNIGGAMVSDLHANFIVNSDNATSKDVLDLVDAVRAAVKAKSDVELESEVLYIPFGKEE